MIACNEIMAYLGALLCVLVLFTVNVAANVSPEELNTLDRTLLEVDLLKNVNLTDFELAIRDDHPHVHMDVIELISYYEYKAETHNVLTDDGYIVTMHRITGNKKNPTPKGKPAVLLQHGLLCSSMDWVITGPERGLGFILADAGYDVWLGNARGNRYSRKHNNFTIDNAEFWEFSWHHMGTNDLPKKIDYILETTGNKKISYVGHSQGSTTFLVMLSEHPDYNEKISIMFSLAPVAYCSHMFSPVFRTLAALTPTINAIMKLLGRYEFRPGGKFFQKFSSMLCKDENLSHHICTNVIFMICGYSVDQMDTKLLPAILAHCPAGASTKQFVHYAQLIHSGHFRQFDYGWLGNLKQYNSLTPPSYKFENIRAPISLHYSSNDWLSHIKDVEKLYSKLPNAVGKFRVPHENFNHLDYLWGKDAHTLVYEKIISLMRRYAN